MSGLAEACALLLAVRVVVDIGAGGSALSVGRTELSVRDALLIAVVAESVALVCHALIASSAAEVGATVLRESRHAALARYVRAPWSIQSVQREGSIQELVTSLSFRTSEMAQWMAFCLGQAVILAMFVTAAFVVDWRFTSFILAAGVGVVFLVRPLSKSTQKRAENFVAANSHYAEEVSRLASSSMELKSFGVGILAESQLAALNEDVSVRQYRARFAALFAGNVFKDIAVFLLIGSVAGLYWLGPAALASAGVVVTLIIRGLASAQQASASYQAISESMPNLLAFNDRLENLVAEPTAKNPIDLGTFESMALRNVGYSYSGSEDPALWSVDLDIQAGEFVGVVGPSGGGKSTLLQLMLRLRLPTVGTITVNGHDFREISSRDWNHVVSLVPQEPSLLEASIADNISYYRPIGPESIREAALAANILDEILALPYGFETRLGPRGSGLSGGQKQRIAIARALAGGPSLLVMDEPTSALDLNSERVVLDTIMSLRGRTTMILVAHRLSTVEHCDYLVRVENGAVAPVGR